MTFKVLGDNHVNANLVKVTGAAEPSGIPVIITQDGNSDGGARLGGYRGSRSRSGGRKKKSPPRPNERRKHLR
jgi:nicotinamidase-related amidase